MLLVILKPSVHFLMNWVLLKFALFLQLCAFSKKTKELMLYQKLGFFKTCTSPKFAFL